MPFKYDHNGICSQKTVTENGVTTTTDYTYHGKLLAAMTLGSDVLRFEYDAQNRPSIVMFNGTRYAYLHNLQGDIVGIMDSAGSLVVEYRYDAWGKLLSTTGSMAGTLGTVNPLRYRGYVYDSETELYYLQNRYYRSNSGRFNNADTQIRSSATETNLYAYGSNNIVSRVDPNGKSSEYSVWYESADEAAEAFAEEINPTSITENVEYCAIIIMRFDENGEAVYSYTKPRTDNKEHGVNVYEVDLLNVSLEYNIVGMVHTHADQSDGYIDEQFSKADMAFFFTMARRFPSFSYLYMVDYKNIIRRFDWLVASWIFEEVRKDGTKVN